jgi:hypothetical protein
MSNELVVSGGGAVVPSTETAVGEHVGDVSRESAPSFDWSPREPLALAELRRQMVRDLVIDGMSEREIELCLPVLEDHAPAIRAAFKASNRRELARLAESIRDELIRNGLISHERIQRIKPILQRYSQESERALIGAGAHDSKLIDEMRDLDSLMANRETRYYKGPDATRLQQRWRELYDQGVRTDGERGTADTDVGSRIAQIEALMDKPNSEYYHGPSADVLQHEYRDLIDRRDHAQHNRRQ